MEDAPYDVKANDLTFITRYPDVQGTGDSFLAGYHGKGAYSGQGKLFVANNGEPGATYPSGVLASWDGSVRGAGDANPQRMTAWSQDFRVQHCEVTGPGDLRGNTGATDPVWATGFDAKSVVLRTYEAGQWTTWRLPKGSYTHDAPHGWYTEWPRIRELDPASPGGPWLTHMHGLLHSFPPTFSAANSAGLTPLCAYEKMPVDYCTFGGRLVIGKSDTSRFSNALVPRAQSNLWWGQLGDLEKWGAPHGHGCVWLSENVAASTVSEPLLTNGFSRATLHLRHTRASAVGIESRTSNGSGAWSPLRTVTIPASGYLSELLNDSGAQWIRLRAISAATNLAAQFILANPYPHTAATSEFAALASIADTTAPTDGIIRTVNASDLLLELAASLAFTVESDFLGDNTWSPYGTSAVVAGQTFTHVFPSGYHAHWVRVKSDTATTATAQFTYGPASGTFAAWQSQTWPGVSDPGIVGPIADPEKDGIANLLEYAQHLAPTAPDTLPVLLTRSGANLDYSEIRSLTALNSGMIVSVEWSDTLAENSWSTTGVNESIVAATSAVQTVQATPPAGNADRRFVRLRVTM